ncbi:TonB-linked outer membrane protein, SusC/RagA family [Bacteroidales bacterium WCE2008]|nr:TonB-linked outer membrane protein, SusC/RagA family [Bacteroidales bacterium WCE2008]
MKKFFTLILLTGMSMVALAQNVSVKGKVLDSGNDPIIGAFVVQQGTSNGTTTGAAGDFSLNAPQGSVLEISCIGYKSQSVIVVDGSPLTIILADDSELLDETIVIGYGVQKKSVVTASISKVDGDQLNTVKASTINDALKGKVSGVQITQASGQPGSGSQIKIRGIGTVNNSEPLFIVDGMPVDGGIDYLNPTDIKSVEILKDAASAAIYGARAANGVVLVTTRTGEKGKATITYNGSYGWQNPWRKKEVLNAQEYMTIMNEARANDGNAPLYALAEVAAAGKGTDWQDETFNYNAPVQQHQLSVSGGSEKVTYFLSLGYYKQDGIIGGNYGKSNYDRLSLRSNNSYVPYENKDRNYLNKLTLTANIAYSRITSRGIETNSEFGSVLGSAVAFNPAIPVFADEAEAAAILAAHPTAVVSKDGRVYSLPPSGYQELTNPVAFLATDENNIGNSDKFVTSFSAELDILPGLKFKSSYGTDLSFWGNDGYAFPYYRSSMRYLNQSNVSSSMNRGLRWQTENFFSYNKQFGKHNISAVIGQSAMSYQFRYISGTDQQLLETNPDKANIDSSIAPETLSTLGGGTGGYDFVRLASYFGRFDYNYDERYMLQLTLRRDGSSHFGPGHKWATFPAVSVGWNVTNEQFMKNLGLEWLNQLKIRGSWGKNGNENIGNFRYTSLMDGGQNYYFGVQPWNVGDDSLNGNMQYGSSPAALANPTIRWEESEQVDLGLDARMLNDRLSFGFDYYKKKTNGMLMDMPIPSYVGQSAPMSNLGDMENWGLEFEIGWQQQVGDFHYSVNANASFLRNKLINLGNESGEAVYQSNGASGVGDYVKGQNGEVWPFFYGYKTDGIFQNWDEVNSYVDKDGNLRQPQAQPGDVRFADVNGDGYVNDQDRTKIGKGQPDWTYGLTLAAEWKGFDATVFFQGSQGNDIFDYSMRGDIPAMNRPAWILDRWIGEGTSTRIPRVTNSNPNQNWRSSDLYVKDGSYLRLKTAQIGYTIPAKLVAKTGLSNIRVYVAGENLLTFTKYDGFDPEMASAGYTTLGVDRGIYPQSRTITVGASITF